MLRDFTLARNSGRLGRTEKLVLFKIGTKTDSLINQSREEIPAKDRADRKLNLINFVNEHCKIDRNETNCESFKRLV